MKTYSEARQAAYSKAAAAMFDVASSVLNDCSDPAEYAGTTFDWARGLAKDTAEKAYALKEQALAEGSGYSRAVVAAQSRYSEAVTRHLGLRDRYDKSKA